MRHVKRKMDTEDGARLTPTQKGSMKHAVFSPFYEVELLPFLCFDSTSPSPRLPAATASLVLASTMFDMLTTRRARGLFPRPLREVPELVAPPPGSPSPSVVSVPMPLPPLPPPPGESMPTMRSSHESPLSALRLALVDAAVGERTESACSWDPGPFSQR